MFLNESPSISETVFQETYASSSRTNEAIKDSLYSVLNDFSLAEEVIGDFNELDWIN